MAYTTCEPLCLGVMVRRKRYIKCLYDGVPRDTGESESRAPCLLLVVISTLDSEQRLQLLRLGMIGRVPHPVAPPQLSSLEQPLSSVLPARAARQRVTGRESPPHGTKSVPQEARVDVVGVPAGQCVIGSHAQRFVALLARVRVDGETAVGFLGVEGNADRLPAADDRDLCARRREAGLRKVPDQGLDVLFAALGAAMGVSIAVPPNRGM